MGSFLDPLDVTPTGTLADCCEKPWQEYSRMDLMQLQYNLTKSFTFTFARFSSKYSLSAAVVVGTIVHEQYDFSTLNQLGYLIPIGINLKRLVVNDCTLILNRVFLKFQLIIYRNMHRNEFTKLMIATIRHVIYIRIHACQVIHMAFCITISDAIERI